MIVDPYVLTFSLLTVIATILMGFWAARKSKTAHDFYVAGRSVSVGWNASAISGEYLSAASFMGVAGMVMSSGYDALWYPVCYACGYLFLLLFIAGPLRRFGAYTIPDFAEGRFSSPRFRRLAVGLVILIGLFYTLPQMKAAGITVATAAGMPYASGVVIVAVKVFDISVPVFVLLIHHGTPGRLIGAAGGQPVPRLTAATAFTVSSGDL